MIQKLLFDSCPLCESIHVVAEVGSITKDMSLSGFVYGKCGSCSSYYLRNATFEALDAFYGSIGAYESASSKVAIVDELARVLNLTGRERALDLGCGSGAWALPMLSHVAHMTCVDLDPRGIDALVARVPQVDRVRVASQSASAHAFLDGCTEGAFDLVLSMFSLEHDTQPRAVLSKIRHVLAPGGRAVVLVPSADALQLAILGSGFYWFQAPWHAFIPGRAGLRQAAAAAGFAQCRAVVTTYPFYSWFWVRGLADRWCVRKLYDRLRRFRWFVRADIAIDEALDRVSFRFGRPSYGLYILEQ